MLFDTFGATLMMTTPHLAVSKFEKEKLRHTICQSKLKKFEIYILCL